MLIQKYLEKIISFFKRYKIPFFVLWFLVIAFIALDGINRNIGNIDIDFLFKGIYNNRLVLYIPVWGYSFLKIVRNKESKLRKFFEKYSLLLFIIILNIFNILRILPYDNYISYIVRLIISFFVVVAVIPFAKRVIKILEGRTVNSSNEVLNTEVLFTKKEICFCIGLVILTLLTRFLFLDGLAPTTDEYLHLVEAKKELSPATDLFNNGEYTRAYFLTWTVEKLFAYFGMAVSVARIPGVIASCITVVLSYVLLKKENKTLAILASLLFAFSPWSSMLSRTIREYIYFLPVFLVLGVYVYKRVKKILEKNYNLFNIVIDILIFLILSYYSFVIDPLSTAKFFVIIYGTGFIYWLVNICIRKNVVQKVRNNIYLKKIPVIMGGIFVLLILANKLFGFSFSVSQIDIVPSFNPSWIEYVFLNGEYGSLILSGIFLLAGLVYSIINIKKNGAGSFSAYATIAFLAIIYFFTFHFGRYYRPRYISIVLPFIICLEAYGFLFLKDFLFEELHICKGKILVLFLLLVNWAYVFYSFLSNGTGYVKISQEFHEGYGLVYEEIKDRDEGYVLVTTLPDAADWYWDEDILDIFLLSYTDEDMENRLDSMVRTYDKGFFVIDSRRNIWGGNIFKYIDYTTLSGYKLKFISTVDVYMIYEWNKSVYAVFQ